MCLASLAFTAKYLRAGLFVSLLLVPTLEVDAQARTDLRIGTTPVFLDDQLAFTTAWQQYLERKTQHRLVFVRRASYGEVVELLQRGQIDFAWLCGYPYVRNKRDFRLLAVPVFHGKPLYQSYLIVPKEDRKTRGILDLRDKVFAYSDPNSNSGWLVPQYTLRRAGIEPASFFRKAFFTWGHRKVVQAVADGLADGGAVDGYVWETLALQHPELTAKTRVAQKSPDFGFPPLVANRNVSANDFMRLQNALLEMHNDAEGRVLLAKLNLDKFISGDDDLFSGIESMMRFVTAN